MTSDAVVIGSGPNGLVAANVLADAGLGSRRARGPARAGRGRPDGGDHRPRLPPRSLQRLLPPGRRLAGLQDTRLEDFGLRWRRAPYALAHPVPDGRCAVIAPDRGETEASLETFGPGDGAGWRSLMAPWDAFGLRFVGRPPQPLPADQVRGPSRRKAQAQGRPRARPDEPGPCPTPGRGAVHRRGGGASGRRQRPPQPTSAPRQRGAACSAGCCAPSPSSVGFPVPEGGAGALTAALIRRLESLGGQVRCGAEVRGSSSATAGRPLSSPPTASEFVPSRAILADVGAPQLYHGLLAGVACPEPLRHDLDRFQWDAWTVKVDWALSAPIPWSAPDARRAGTVHVADSLDELTRWSADLATGTVPAQAVPALRAAVDDRPDSPAAGRRDGLGLHPRPAHGSGTDAGGAISGRWDSGGRSGDGGPDRETHRELAPGFGASIIGRHVFTPEDPGGRRREPRRRARSTVAPPSCTSSSSSARRAGLRPPATFVDGLFLASAGAHPGGGVHGACGANAARAAIAACRIRRRGR